MEFTIAELTVNYEKLITHIKTHISAPRRELLIGLYKDHEERVMLMPASGTDHHHNAFAGGYVDHVLRVIDCAMNIRDLWLAHNATEDHTVEELVFAAINHDIGKIGTESAEQYIVNDSDWHRKNQGKMYKYNPENAYMTVPDRGLFLLQQRGIVVSANEYLAIKLHDGLYDDANKSYYISYSKDSKLRSNLPIILHQADSMASRIEYEKWYSTNGAQVLCVDTQSKKRSLHAPTDLSDTRKDDLINVFNTLFAPDK